MNGEPDYQKTTVKTTARHVAIVRQGAALGDIAWIEPLVGRKPRPGHRVEGELSQKTTT